MNYYCNRLSRFFTPIARSIGVHAFMQNYVQEELHVEKKRVARLMRRQGISARRRRPRVTTTNSQHLFPIAPNLLQRNFAADAPDTVWVSDFTYISTREGWLYLATVLDVYSRRIVGWSMSHQRDEELVKVALHLAVSWRKPAPGLIHHSDRRSQYANTCYQSRLQHYEMVGQYESERRLLR
ncbi:MAG TPA: IS3 family transposase [Ktedonobacteraceae bacterium]|nr:IS3 family transposase [Ktedonobacteraceae bacterium]